MFWQLASIVWNIILSLTFRSLSLAIDSSRGCGWYSDRSVVILIRPPLKPLQAKYGDVQGGILLKAAKFESSNYVKKMQERIFTAFERVALLVVDCFHKAIFAFLPVTSYLSRPSCVSMQGRVFARWRMSWTSAHSRRRLLKMLFWRGVIKTCCR